MKKKLVQVLVVEDTPEHANIIKDFLKASKISSFKVTLAETPKDSLKQLEKTNSFDVILLDLELPDSTELNSLEQVHSAAPDIPIIAISSREGEKLEIEAVQKGAQDYMVKFNFTGFILASRIRFAMERQRMLLEIKEARQKDQKTLKSDMESHQTLTGWKETSVTAQVSGVGPLQKRFPDIFKEVREEYCTLLDLYLESLGFKKSPPRRRINELADIIGDYGGGPQDVVDVHLISVMEKVDKVNPKRARAFATEGRLLALEVMGNLVDYYRRGGRRS